VIVLFVPPVGTEAAEVAAAIQRGGAGATKPVLTSFMGMHGVPAALSSLREGRLPVVRLPRGRGDRPGAGGALRPLAGARRRRGARARRRRGRARAAIGDHHGWLPADATRAVLAAYGIAQPSTQLAATAEAAATAASAVGYPVAIKLASATITHKTDVGGVILDVADAAAARQAFADIHARLAAIGRAAEMDGVTVQPMVPARRRAVRRRDPARRASAR
jgi:acyl-CoA synthetase (NDP forming)